LGPLPPLTGLWGGWGFLEPQGLRPGLGTNAPSGAVQRTPKGSSKNTRGCAARCAFCGVPLRTPWSSGDYEAHAHHLQPLLHGGEASVDNCVYLCRAHHLFLGHGMAPLGIDPQGGSSDTWVQLEPEDFPFWEQEGGSAQQS